MAFMPPIITVMIKAAEAASRSLLRDFNEVENLQVSVKGPSDFVSAADKRAEKIIYESLSRTRPGWGFLMEESGEYEGAPDKGRFIVDPLDGTHNFLHGIPHWCINIAAEDKGEIIAAVTFDPIKNEMFWASKGDGAFMNNRKLRVSGRRDMAMSMIAGPLPHKGRGNAEQAVRNITRLSSVMGDVRAFHSGALDIAYVAAGRLEACWTHDTHPWDIAAGILMVREAGGIVTTLDGSQNPVYCGDILATNAELHKEIRSLFD